MKPHSHEPPYVYVSGCKICQAIRVIEQSAPKEET